MRGLLFDVEADIVVGGDVAIEIVLVVAER